MPILKIRDDNGSFIEIPAIKGTDGKDGTNGKDGKSVEVVKATNEEEAITLSKQNPNNIYYWE